MKFIDDISDHQLFNCDAAVEFTNARIDTKYCIPVYGLSHTKALELV
jgi:hypothetical protein